MLSNEVAIWAVIIYDFNMLSNEVALWATDSLLCYYPFYVVFTSYAQINDEWVIFCWQKKLPLKICCLSRFLSMRRRYKYRLVQKHEHFPPSEGKQLSHPSQKHPCKLKCRLKLIKLYQADTLWIQILMTHKRPSANKLVTLIKIYLVIAISLQKSYLNIRYEGEFPYILLFFISNKSYDWNFSCPVALFF